MTLSLKPLTTTLLGGLVFLLPLIVVLAVLGQGLALVARVAQPLAGLVSTHEVGGVAVASLVALALLLLLCYGAGLLARAAVGRTLSENFEDRLHALYPRYTVIKGMAQGFSAAAVKSKLKTVLVSFDDHQQMAVEVERLDDGRVVVFLPGAPDPWSGNVVLVPRDRVSAMPVEIGALQRVLKGIGRGSAALLQAPTHPGPGTGPDRAAAA
ncbi:MAG: hypothetical protein ACRC2B_19395 [Rubrivivax sp.]